MEKYYLFSIIIAEQTPKVPELTVDVKEYIQQNAEILAAFLQYASERKTAVGLAANQVSFQEMGEKGAITSRERLMLRCFAIRSRQGVWRLIINPEITEYIGTKFTKSEGCLTWPDNKIIADRSFAVKVSYYTIDGEKVEGEIYRGFEAQIWQHECNHINGVEERIEEREFTLPNQPAIGRNDDCPCGSGKKFKKCCQQYIDGFVIKREPSLDEKLGKAGERTLGNAKKYVGRGKV